VIFINKSLLDWKPSVLPLIGNGNESCGATNDGDSQLEKDNHLQLPEEKVCQTSKRRLSNKIKRQNPIIKVVIADIG
jgi:hypothetical protein